MTDCRRCDAILCPHRTEVEEDRIRTQLDADATAASGLVVGGPSGEVITADDRGDLPCAFRVGRIDRVVIDFGGAPPIDLERHARMLRFQ